MRPPVLPVRLVGAPGRVRAALSLLLLGLTAAALMGCLGSRDVREQTFDLGSRPSLVVRNENGDIEVRASDDREVQVRTALRNPSLVEYSLRRVGDDQLEIAARGRRNSVLDHLLFWRTSSAHVVVTVPPNTAIELQASNGKIFIEGLQRSGSARTSNGSITVQDVAGVYDLRTSNGPVVITSFEGIAEVQTSNGPVTLTDVYGTFDVGASNGSIRLSGRLLGRNRLTTSNGDVDVSLDGQASLYLRATTSNGRITSKLPIITTDASDGRLVGRMGAGDTELEISTSNGSISLE